MLQAGRSLVRDPDEVEFFNWANSSSRTMALELTQPLTEMSTRNLPGGKKRPARRADNLVAICESNYVGASTSRNPKGLHGLYRENCTLTCSWTLWFQFRALNRFIVFKAESASSECVWSVKPAHFSDATLGKTWHVAQRFFKTANLLTRYLTSVLHKTVKIDKTNTCFVFACALISYRGLGYISRYIDEL
jgi:hypothetical protein